MKPIRYLFVNSLNDAVLEEVCTEESCSGRTETYYSPYIPTVLRGPGILFFPVTKKITFACFQDYLKDTSVSSCYNCFP